MTPDLTRAVGSSCLRLSSSGSLSFIPSIQEVVITLFEERSRSTRGIVIAGLLIKRE